MARKRSSASGIANTPAADDFKLIKGIGPSFERQLHSAGIRTYDQLASLTTAAVADLLSGSSTEQIAKQKWIGQARKLASKQKSVHPRNSKSPKRLASPRTRQHYATFTVELLLDEVHDVRRSRVAHIQSGEEDTWAGWQDMRLLDFFVKHAALRLPRTERPDQPDPTAKRAVSLPVADLKGTLRLRELTVVPVNSNLPVYILNQGQPFQLHLTLDLTEVVNPGNVPLDYKATIVAQARGGIRQLLGEEHDTLFPSETVTIRLTGLGLPSDIYRIEAFVKLTPAGMKPDYKSGLMAFLESGPLEIY